MSATDPLRNPKDPLHLAGPEAERDLFRKIGALCGGYPNEVVENVAGMLLINAIRQNASLWRQAEARMAAHHGRFTQILKDHYDGVSGRKKGVFPYAQHIIVDGRLKGMN